MKLITMHLLKLLTNVHPGTMIIPAINRLHRLYSSLSDSTSQLSLGDIREQLSEFKGGEVSLTYAGNNNHVAVISVSHPERRNAVTGSMCVSLYDIIQRLSTDTTSKAVLVRGSQGMFCAGADLIMARKIADPVNGERFSYFMQCAMTSLRNLPLPSYASLQGNILGGGAEMMLACDFAIAAPNINVQFVQGHMGIVPGWAGATHLVGKVGYHKALDILLSGRGMTTEYAHSIGLVDYVIAPPGDSQQVEIKTFSDELLLEKSLEIIDQQVGHLPAEVVRGLKCVSINSSRLGYNEAVTNERNVFKSLWGAQANINSLSLNLKHVKR